MADGVTPSSAAARRKLRCWATLRNASTPSSAPCLTVKFRFITHQNYRELSYAESGVTSAAAEPKFRLRRSGIARRVGPAANKLPARKKIPFFAGGECLQDGGRRSPQFLPPPPPPRRNPPGPG